MTEDDRKKTDVAPRSDKLDAKVPEKVQSNLVDTSAVTNEITLPSGFEAIVQEMSGTEEQMLRKRMYLKNGQAIQTVLTNCIIKIEGEKTNEKMISDLTAVDRQFALLAIRATTYGDEILIDEKCNECGKDLGEMVFIEKLLEERVRKPLVVGEWDIEINGEEWKFKPLNGHDEMQLLRMQTDDLFDTLLVRLVSVAGDKTRRRKDEFLKLSGRLLMKIRETIKTNEGSIDTSFRYSCASCGTPNDIDAMGVATFLYPLM